MSDRLKSMRRVVAVQAQVKRMAEWKLAAIEQRKAALEVAKRELAGFLDGGDLTGPLATVALKHPGASPSAKRPPSMIVSIRLRSRTRLRRRTSWRSE